MARPRKSVLDQVLAEAGLAENLPTVAEPEPEPEPKLEPEPEPEPKPEPEPEPEQSGTVQSEDIPFAEGGVAFSSDVVLDTAESEEVVVPESLMPQSCTVTVQVGPASKGMDLTEDEAKVILKRRLKEILSRSKPRNPPTLVRFRQNGLVPLRAVFVELGEVELREGWELYKTYMSPDPERYLLMVYELTCSEIPRLYSTVVELRLE